MSDTLLSEHGDLCRRAETAAKEPGIQEMMTVYGYWLSLNSLSVKAANVIATADIAAISLNQYRR